MRKLLLILLVAACSNKSFAQVIHVPTEQPTIQDGLNAASFGDTVLVAPGTYFENITWPSVNGIKLIAEGDTSDTFIDGSGIGRCIKMVYPQIDTSTVVIGLTMTNGKPNDTLLGGGGIIIHSASPLIESCRFTQNNAGYDYGIGMLIWNSMAIIRNTSIDNNYLFSHESAGFTGIGAAIVHGSSPRLDNVNISNNHFTGGVVKGVGLSAEPNCHVEIINSVISNNTADGEYEVRGIGVFGGSSTGFTISGSQIHNNRSLSAVQRTLGVAIACVALDMTNTSIQYNQASASSDWQNGAIIYFSSGTWENVTISDNHFEGGSSNQTHGLISSWNGQRQFNAVSILRNTMSVQTQYHTLDGFVLHIERGTLNMSNCLIAENSPTYYTPGHQYNSVMMTSIMNAVTIENSTIAENFNLLSLPFPTNTIECDTSSLTVTNTILNNPRIQTEVTGDNVEISYSDVKGGFTGTGNINVDPMFIGNGDYRLQTFSPCINSGTIATAPDTDIEGNPRPMPVGTNPDMGAYEDDNPSTSILEIADSESISIYPNPTNRFVQISSAVKVESVQVFSGIGQLVAEFIQNEKTIDLSGLPNGIYSVMVISEKRRLTEKLVLSK